MMSLTLVILAHPNLLVSRVAYANRASKKPSALVNAGGFLIRQNP